MKDNPGGIGWGWILAGAAVGLLWYTQRAPSSAPGITPIGPTTVGGVPNVPVVQLGPTSVIPPQYRNLPPAGTPGPNGTVTPLVIVTASPGGGMPVALPINSPGAPAPPPGVDVITGLPLPGQGVLPARETNQYPVGSDGWQWALSVMDNPDLASIPMYFDAEGRRTDGQGRRIDDFGNLVTV